MSKRCSTNSGAVMVRRYDVDESPYGGLRKEDCPHGGSVDYDDYAALQASHARLLEALVRVAKVADRATDVFDSALEAIAAAQPFTET